MQSRRFFWAGCILSLIVGDLLIYVGTMLGFACPGCGLNDPGTWLYTILPWASGAALLILAGLFYQRTVLPVRGVLVSISTTIAIGVILMFVLFALFLLWAFIAQAIRK